VTDAQVIETDGGTITVPPAVLAQIVVRSAEQVDGARVRRQRRGLELEIDGARARVSLELAVRLGRVLPDVAHEVQEQVGESLRSICGLEPESVDVSVEELDG
jgi:uncharacterized alkaline shock family protein YloU